MNCRIEKMAQGGQGLARIDGKVVFIKGALPGELVSIEFTRQRKDFSEAKVLAILEAHAQRVKPECEHYGRCGGCNLQHASIELQRELKRQVVEDHFRRMAKCSLPANWILHGSSPWGYRQRVRFVRGRSYWGFRQASSHDIEPIRNCPVLSPALQKIIPQLPVLERESEIQAFAPSAQAIPVLWEKSMVDAQVQAVQVPVNGRLLYADARVFFQSNLEQLPVLLNAVLAQVEYCGRRERAVDLFSGVGVFAAFLLDHFQKVLAVEWNPGCLQHARKNLQNRCEFISSSAEDFLHSMAPGSIDLLVVDPPRVGLSPDVRKALLQAKPTRLIYVSCDPVTLARDVGEFVRNGWALLHAEGFDFYPQTEHLEMMVVLKFGI